MGNRSCYIEQNLLDWVQFGIANFGCPTGATYCTVAERRVPQGRGFGKDVMPKSSSFNFPYNTCRNITPNGQNIYKVLTGYAPAISFLDIPDDENVRKYLLDVEGNKRTRPGNVHRAIRDTLENNGEQFPVLNGGIVILTSKLEVDDKKRDITLTSGNTNVSIINGSQTRGELREHLKRMGESDQKDETLVHFEIIATDDRDLANEISIARNFQNQVAYLSILGKRTSLEELEQAIQKRIPSANLRKSETDDKGENYLPTEKVLQVCFVLLPDSVFKNLGPKTATYSGKAKWLKIYGELAERAKQGTLSTEQEKQYKCILGIAGEGWKLYEKWKRHAGYAKNFKETRKNGPATVTEDRELMDGMVFPILAALSVFVKEVKGQWTLDIPGDFSDNWEGLLVEAARETYKESGNSNPQIMGKTVACYSATSRVTKMYAQMRGISSPNP